MKTYQVSANGTMFGNYAGETEQQARDACALDAGYQSEAQMVEALEHVSELVATENSMKTVTVQFDVDVPHDATDTQIEEWVAFEVGARCLFNSAGNPLAHTDLQAKHDSVRVH